MRKVFIIFLVFLILSAIVLMAVVGLEIISQKHEQGCQQNISYLPEYGLSCYELKLKYRDSEEKSPTLLFEIMAKRDSGKKVSIKEYRRLSEELVSEVDRSEISGNNGIACGRYGFVSRDLPNSAKKFVKRHELAHILGQGNEFAANLEAAREYPFGFVQTGIISAFGILRNPNYSLFCNVLRLWQTIKVYVLPLAPELPKPPIEIY